MPALDKISIAPADMKAILESVQQLRYTGDIIIIDTIQSYTIRDINDMFLTEVPKSEPSFSHQNA